MNTTTTDLLRYSMDRLVVNNKRLFGWGWVTHFEYPVHAVELILINLTQEHRFSATLGLLREDVVHSFPDWPHVNKAGFVVSGYVMDNTSLLETTQVLLHVLLENGEESIFSVHQALEIRSPPTQQKNRWHRLLLGVGRKILRFEWRDLWVRVKSEYVLGKQLDDSNLLDALTPALSSAHRLVIMFDHSMGGGSNHYRQLSLQAKLKQEETVLLCTYHLSTLEYQLHIFVPNQPQLDFRLVSYTNLKSIIQHFNVHEIFLNSVVSFEEPLLLAEWLVQMKQLNTQLRLVIAMHEYFVVCRSFVLLNDQGQYCNLPPLEICETCLIKNKARHMDLSPPSVMIQWRGLWGHCLNAADEIRCFSNSTKKILCQAYPLLAQDKITVIPHQLDFIPQRLPVLNQNSSIKIGIIGHINFQKGGQIVAELIQLIEQQELLITIVVIGTLDVAITSKHLMVLGHYQRDALPDLIEQYGLNSFFFPSVCPETFSYVTEEMIMLQLPIVAFNVGAPADRIQSYDKGRLCSEISADAALKTLIAFHQELSDTMPQNKITTV